jgi:hypothetical protein
LKYLLNYGIKICQNVAYLLTTQKPYYVDRTMFGATSFANAIKPKPFDGSNFKRWCELAILWLTTKNVMYVATGKASRVSRRRNSKRVITCSGVPSLAF